MVKMLLTLAFLSTCPRTAEGFVCNVCLRSREALLMGREQVSVSLVSQLDMGELSTVLLNNTGDYKQKRHNLTLYGFHLQKLKVI